VRERVGGGLAGADAAREQAVTRRAEDRIWLEQPPVAGKNHASVGALGIPAASLHVSAQRGRDDHELIDLAQLAPSLRFPPYADSLRAVSGRAAVRGLPAREDEFITRAALPLAAGRGFGYKLVPM
jgi:hypothetical protein